MRNKKALSAVVIMVIMVALVMAVMAVVFTLTKKTVEEKIEQTESCGINLLDKLSINSEFVCYDSSSQKFVFSINRGDIELDNLLIAIETETKIIQFQLDGNDQEFCGETNELYNYGKDDCDPVDKVTLPGKKAGKTYITTNFLEPVIAVQIAPFIGGKQCEVVDTITNIIDCSGTTILG